MAEKNVLNDESMNKVSGGVGSDIPAQHFFKGDKVLLMLYPQYGVGIVREAVVVAGSWQLTVQFDAGMMTADEYEFIPA